VSGFRSAKNPHLFILGHLSKSMIFCLIFTHSCGKTAESLAKNGSLGKLESGSSSASSTLGPGIEVKVDGHNSSELLGNALSELSLYTSLQSIGLSPESSEIILQNASTKIKVTNPLGRIMEETKPAGKKTWTINTQAEGLYVIEFAASHARKEVVKSFPVFRMQHHSDRTPPEMSGAANVSADVVTGDKKVLGTVQYFDSSPTQCQVKIESPSNKTSKPIEVDAGNFEQLPLPSEKQSGQLKFLRKEFSVAKIPADFGSPLLLHVKCQDLAQNQSEAFYNISPDPIVFSLKSSLNAKLAPLPEDPNTQVRYVGAKGISLKNELIEVSTGSVLHASVAELQKEAIRVSISKLSPADLVPFKIHPETYFFGWKQDFEQPFPGTFLGRQDFYVGLWKKNKDGLDSLVNFEKFEVYYDTTAPEFAQWADKSQIANPTMGTALPFGFKIAATGARSDPTTFKVQQSADGVTWSPIEFNSMTYNGISGFYEGRASYPYNDVRNLKIRILGEDFSGNSFVSPASPLIVENKK
jgi:hypothetical protein